MILVVLIKFIKKLALDKLKDYEEIFKHYYVRDKLLSLILNSLLFLLMSAAWLALIRIVYSFIIKSLFYLEMFVPTSLVDINAIVKIVKNYVFMSSASQTYKLADVLISYWSEKLIIWAFVFFYLGGVFMIRGKIGMMIKNRRK